MFVDYREKVVLAYRKKREANAISMNLLYPTPAKLKDECLNVYKERPSPKDENTIRLFFGSKDEITDYGQRIKKIEPDRFKPLINFLNGKTTGTDDKNIELLAWLIDFESRPYIYGHNYKDDVEAAVETGSVGCSETTENENSGIAIITSDPDDKNDGSAHYKLTTVTEVSSAYELEEEKPEEVLIPIPVGEKKGKEEVQVIRLGIQAAFGKAGYWKRTTSKPKVRNIIITSIAIVIVFSGSSLFLSNRDQQCMYWTGTRYKPIACNQTVGYTPIIALDTTKVSRLHKITHPDTLTKYSLNRVWYARIDGKLEFYTSDGFHPIYNDRRLKPLSPYILDKYIIKK